MAYLIKINKRAFNDIQKALSYYDTIDTLIADKFLSNLNRTINSIASNTFFQNRYTDVKCLLVPKFPYMIHFQVKERKNFVVIRAVINTSKNPKTNWVK